ncbi:MAG: plasmid segregation centromere-binding protein ParR [Firmicutes bacterium]|nr:plasmid segregation centromere-binding protein ParR [Bacillota bacterium]
MRRPVFSFRPNMDNPEHRRAWEMLQNIPEGQKNGFLVRAILKEREAGYLEEVIRQAVREELSCGRTAHKATQDLQGELPGQVLDFISMLQEE